MSKYWKLLVLSVNQYIECETEEEVNHLIDSLCKDMEEERLYKRHIIETQHPNYNFEHVTVFDSSNVRQFIYFFDTFEEECDSLEERIGEIKARCDEKYDEMKCRLEQTINNQASLILILNKKLHESEESNHLDELFEVQTQLFELQTQRDNLVNKNAELEGKLTRYAGEIDRLKYELSNSRSTNENLRELVKQINDMTHPF